MGTPDDTTSDSKAKRIPGAKKQLKKLIGRGAESATTEMASKQSQPHTIKGQHTQHNANTQSHKPPPVTKQPNSKDDLVINKLNQEFADMKKEREMSADAKNDANVHLSLPAYDLKLEDSKQVRHVTDAAQIPISTQASNDPDLTLPAGGQLAYSMPTGQTITHAAMVAEPETIPASIPGRSTRRPSVSQPVQSIPYDNSVATAVYRRQLPRHNSAVVNGHPIESCEALKSKLQRAQHEKQELQRDLENMTQLVRERERQMDLIERSRESMASELNTARYGCEQSKAATTKLEDEIAQAREDLRDWQGRFGMVNNELLQLRSGLDKHVSDKWFQTQWRDLNTKIEAVSNQYFVGRQSRFQGSILSRGKGTRPEKLELNPTISLTRLTSEHAHYLGSMYERPLIIQAFIWWVLVNRIFGHVACDEWGFFWAGQSRDLLHHLKRQVLPPRPRDWPQADSATSQRLETDARNYHTWRATTAMLLLARTPVDKRIKTIRDLIDELVGDVLQAVSHYIVLSKETSPGAAEDGFRKQLEAIFVEAIKVDAEMAQQRAWVYCEQWRAHREGDPLWGFTCSQDEADVVQTSDQTKGRRVQIQGSCVELIIQPALFRDGNQYGEEYARQQVLCKAKVVLGETALPSFQHR